MYWIAYIVGLFCLTGSLLGFMIYKQKEEPEVVRDSLKSGINELMEEVRKEGPMSGNVDLTARISELLKGFQIFREEKKD